jgi:hypothetical protein
MGKRLGKRVKVESSVGPSIGNPVWLVLADVFGGVAESSVAAAKGREKLDEIIAGVARRD